MTPNTNPETGIRYGIISANSLDQEVVMQIQMEGRDVHWEARVAEIRAEVEDDESVDPEDREDEIEMRIERESDCFYDDEPVHEFDIDCPGYGRVKGRTTWVSGLCVWIFESPFTGAFGLCSPCVPNCCDLDRAGGYEGYDVPADWRDQSHL
jgi:hypothetical protein